MKRGDTGGRRSHLIFHGIGTPGRALEPGEDIYWFDRNRFRAILDRISGHDGPAPVITFDDGNASDAAIALPELERRGLRAIFFLLAGRLDRPGSLSRDAVRALAAAGQTIGLHGHAHTDWRRLNPEGRRAEYRQARETLRDLSGQPVDLAAAPFGFYNRQVAADLQTERLRALYTSDWGRARDTGFLRGRNCLDNTMTDAEIDRCIRGDVPPLRRPRLLLGLARKRLLPLRLAS